MPAHLRALCYWQVNSLLPRDRMSINPCFRHQTMGIGEIDGAALANDLATALKAWELAPTNHELTVKIYDIEGTKPVRPIGTKVLQPAAASAASFPSELACCLSFYGGQNRPDQRGRLYIPQVKMSVSAPGVRPTSTERLKVGDLVPILANLGGLNVDWIVWSQTRRAATKVTNWFVDDEWDVQRRRGLKPTARTSGTTSG